MMMKPLPGRAALLFLASLLVPGAAAFAAPRDAPKGFSLTSEPSQAKVGQPATVRVHLDATKGMHVNTEYPTAMTVKYPPGVEGPAGRIKPKNIDKSAALFEIGVAAREPGAKILDGTVSFVVCSDDNTSCIPRKEAIAIQLDATN